MRWAALSVTIIPCLLAPEAGAWTPLTTESGIPVHWSSPTATYRVEAELPAGYDSGRVDEFVVSMEREAVMLMEVLHANNGATKPGVPG